MYIYIYVLLRTTLPMFGGSDILLHGPFQKHLGSYTTPRLLPLRPNNAQTSPQSYLGSVLRGKGTKGGVAEDFITFSTPASGLSQHSPVLKLGPPSYLALARMQHGELPQEGGKLGFRLYVYAFAFSWGGGRGWPYLLEVLCVFIYNPIVVEAKFS